MLVYTTDNTNLIITAHILMDEKIDNNKKIKF